jgi:HemY protein
MMVRTFLYLFIVAGVAVGLAWFADHPGEITVVWLGYEARPSVYVAAIGLTIAMGVLFAVGWLVVYVVSGPRRIADAFRRRRERKGFEALRLGIYAVGAGDQWRAEKYAHEARKALPNEPLTKLLRAQAAQMSGDRAAARVIFESMVDESGTDLLGLRGLYLEARREQETEAAAQFAQKAAAQSPGLAWPGAALFELQCQSSDWRGALNTLAILRQYRHIDRKTADRRRAVLLTAEALKYEEIDSSKAAELALEAHKLAPDLAPAAAVAGRVLAGQGKTNKAAKIIATAWERSPHPDLAACYAYARPGDSPRDRLVRVKALASLNPDHFEARMALATAAADAHEWEEARAALEPLVRNRPTGKVCASMARIESGQYREAGRVREWMARAIRAPRDAMWVADGVVSEHWAPVSPATGALDAFVWAVPPEETGARAGAALIAGIVAMERELELLNAPAAPMVEAVAPASVTIEDVEVVEPVKAAPVAAPVVAPPSAEKAVEPMEKGVIIDAAATVTPASKTSASKIEKPAVVDVMVEEAPAKAAQATNPSVAGTIVTPSNSATITTAEMVIDVRMTDVTPTMPTTVRPDGQVKPKSRGRTEPRIFVPDRAPDDPGPEGDTTDDPMSPLTRYRMPLKG